MSLHGPMMTVRLSWDDKELLSKLGGKTAWSSGSISRGFREVMAHYRSFVSGNATPPALLENSNSPLESKHDDSLDEAGEDYSFGRNDGLAPAGVEQPEEKAPKKTKAVKPGKSSKTPKPAARKTRRLIAKGKK